MTRPTRDMSDRHERFLAELFGGRITPGSGNHFANQTDVRHDPREPWAFAMDGKSTMARSVSVKLDDWQKVVEQAGPCEPAMPLRFYLNTRLTAHYDLVVVSAKTLADLRHWAILAEADERELRAGD